MANSVHNKLDQILDLSKQANQKIDDLSEQVEHMDKRLNKVEQNMSKVSLKALAAGGLGGAIATIGIELIKAKFGG